MTNDSGLHPAEERLLDAALAQHFAGTVVAPRAVTPHWLVAALLLLGLGVVTMVWVGAGNGARDEAQQPEPVPLPPEVVASGKMELEALPVATENLVAKFVDPRELPVVTRFEQLRGLHLLAETLHFAGINTGKSHAIWSKPPADLLQPLAKLARLEMLQLPRDLAVTPELLAPLAGHPTLRSIQLVGQEIAFDDGLVAALAKLPRLRELHLHGVPVGADAMRCIAKLPLTSLELKYCHDLDAEGWLALVTMQSLRRLAFTDWSWNAVPGRTTQKPGYRPTPADLRRLQRLPNLRCLELTSCRIDNAQLAALPDTMMTLRLLGTNLTAEGITSLSRCLAVRDLAFDTRPHTGTIADVFKADSEGTANAFAVGVQPLRLQSLDYRGALTTDVAAAIGAQKELRELSITSKQVSMNTAVALFGALELQRLMWNAPIANDVLDALAAQKDLRELELRAANLTDLGVLAKAPKLERLTLLQDGIGNGIPAEVLAPLARSASLREITLHVSITRGEPHPSEQDLQRAVGDRIRVRLHESAFTVPK